MSVLDNNLDLNINTLFKVFIESIAIKYMSLPDNVNFIQPSPLIKYEHDYVLAYIVEDGKLYVKFVKDKNEYIPGLKTKCIPLHIKLNMPGVDYIYTTFSLNDAKYYFNNQELIERDFVL